MPTIEELASAVACSDSDELPASQNGIARRVTRAQLLAGVQPQISLAPGRLLGRASAGNGGPEALSIGANLRLVGNQLSADAAPFDIPSLPQARAPRVADMVPLGQSGGNAAIAYGQFMAGLSALPGIDISRLSATAAGSSVSRPIADFLADALPVEAFGAIGDGVTDDTAAFSAAVASGHPIRLGPRTYAIRGQWTVTAPAMLLGVRGQSVLKRCAQSGNGAWISIQGSTFRADGVVFDANGGNIGIESWGILVTSTCLQSEFTGCVFARACGPTLGNGLVIQASDPVSTQHVIRACEAYGNTAHGIWVQAVDGAAILDCRAHDNAGYGICVDYNDPALNQKVRSAQIAGNECWNNARGISVGNYNVTNTQPPVWGNANPDVIGALIVSNYCHDNQVYGIAAAGQALLIQGNFLAGNGSAGNGGAGILANVSSSRVAGNMITGTSQYGIDSGGSLSSDITHNHVAGPVIGLNPGGSRNVRVAHNYLQDCSSWAITVNNIDTDGHGSNFGIAASNIAITDNWILLPSASAGGIYLLDAPQSIQIARNAFFADGDATVDQCLWAHTDSVVIQGNRWNDTQRFICNPVSAGSIQQVQHPDIADAVMITAAPAGVQSMLSLHQIAMQGRIAYIKVTNGGSGYTGANVVIGGSGSGAAAQAIISGGVVIGVIVIDPGSGYGPYGATASVAITGDGTGATAIASVGLPVPEERRLRLSCNCAVRFTRVGSLPFQENWTLGDFTAPANAEIGWVGVWGNWRAVDFPPGDYLNFTGDGTLIVRSGNSADLQLKPGGSGRLRLCTEAEPVGVLSLIGRGSPLGTIAAPPGSEYRNLDGGSGGTLWIKISGQDSSGWAAIA